MTDVEKLMELVNNLVVESAALGVSEVANVDAHTKARLIEDAKKAHQALRTAIELALSARVLSDNGKAVHSRLIQAAHELVAAKDVPAKWGCVGPDAEDIAWSKFHELVDYVCVLIDSPPCLLAAPQPPAQREVDLAEACRHELDKLSQRNYELRMENATLKASEPQPPAQRESEAVLAEREACARVCEVAADSPNEWAYERAMAKRCAAAIRARGAA